MHNDSMFERDEIRHDSFRVCRADKSVRVEVAGHYVELLPAMATDLSEHLKRLVQEITSDA
jgi:hypothetical protein